MPRINTLLGGFLLGLLLLIAAILQIKIAPVLYQIMEGLGDSLWAPARLSIAIADQGLILVPLLLIGVIVGHRRADPERKAAVVLGACLLVVVQLALQLSLFLNFVVAFPSHLGKGLFRTPPKAVEPSQAPPTQP